MVRKKIAVIGAGFAGISAASYLAKAGFEVHVYEKHEGPGGRARQFKTEHGFVFDMGPSWYWMPDIIDGYFNDFGHKTNEFFDLHALDPQFQVIFSNDSIEIPANYEELTELFERLEPGAGAQLNAFMKNAKFKYDISMKDFVRKPSLTWKEFISVDLFKSAFKFDLLTNFRKYVSQYFKNEKIRAIMEFPVIFLGSSPDKIPAMYSLMNYGGYVLGTHYPSGGYFSLVEAMYKIAKKQGVTFHFDHQIDQIITKNKKVDSIVINGKSIEFDGIIASCDYHHAERLLTFENRNYTDRYWKKKTFAPSSLIYYLGLKVKLPKLTHHTLFFEHDIDKHLNSVYVEKNWPKDPLFYVCCPSKTDPTVAPEGKENLFLLMPIGLSMDDPESVREKYLKQMLNRIEQITGVENLYEQIEYKRSYCISDFIQDYHAYGGNAYGLANTLGQTAFLKPKLKNKKVENLYYAGQLTVPGPGVPPSIISGKIAANELAKDLTNFKL